MYCSVYVTYHRLWNRGSTLPERPALPTCPHCHQTYCRRDKKCTLPDPPLSTTYQSLHCHSVHSRLTFLRPPIGVIFADCRVEVLNILVPVFVLTIKISVIRIRIYIYVLVLVYCFSLHIQYWYVTKYCTV